ncbi:MAG TPA: FHA domain-containing protein, partial [Kofleriaceae bacterium]
MSALALTFRIYRADHLVREETLRQGVIKIGKVPSAHLRLDDDSVSRMHAIIEVDTAGRVHVIDLGSTRGTFVNGQKINKARLETGDALQLGDLRIEVAFAVAVEAKVIVAPPPIPVAKPIATPVIPYASAIVDDDLGAATAIEVAAMLGDSVINVKHCIDPKSGHIPATTLGMFGVGAASLLAAAVSFGVSVHTAAANKEGLEHTIRVEHKPAFSFRPEVLSPAWDFAAFGGLALGLSTIVAGLARARAEKRTPTYRIGTAPEVECAIDSAPSASFPLVAPSATGDDFVFNYGAGFTGELVLDGTRTSLADLVASGRAKPSMVIAGALELPIPARAKIRATSGKTTFVVSAVPQPRHHAAPIATLDSRTLAFFGGSLALHLGVLALVSAMPGDDSAANIDLASEEPTTIAFVDSIKDTAPPELTEAPDGNTDGNPGADAKKMKLEEGQAGDKSSTDTDKHLSVKDQKTEPKLTRDQAIEEARNYGFLGSLSSPDRNFSPLLEETGITSGFDNLTYYGNIIGADAGNAHGEFGGGLVGFGRGGGCTQEPCGL